MSRLFRSIKHALNGLKIVLKTEKNFRIHLFIALLAVLIGFWRDLGQVMWIMLLLIISLVMALEIFNSAIERLVDMLAPKTHHFAKEIKDLLAAMVLLVSLFAVVIGFIIFI